MTSRRKPTPANDPDLRALLSSWELHLRAGRKSPETLRSYTAGVNQFLDWCESEGVPARLDRRTVTAFVAARLEAGNTARTVVARQLALQRYSHWLTEEDELDADQIAGMTRPKFDKELVPQLTDDECDRLINACRKNGQNIFIRRRDEAMVRLMLEAAVRAGELVDMEVAEVDVRRGIATVRRGKGGKGRLVPFGPQTGQAIDRYLRQRRSHALADLPELWLGDRSRRLRYQGLYRTLERRSLEAGLIGFHPHITRHTAAQRWLDSGGSEQGLMAVAGWESRDMLDRYTRASASNRAIDEARRLNLGNFD